MTRAFPSKQLDVEHDGLHGLLLPPLTGLLSTLRKLDFRASLSESRIGKCFMRTWEDKDRVPESGADGMGKGRDTSKETLIPGHDVMIASSSFLLSPGFWKEGGYLPRVAPVGKWGFRRQGILCSWMRMRRNGTGAFHAFVLFFCFLKPIGSRRVCLSLGGIGVCGGCSPPHLGGWDAEWEDGGCWVGCDTWERWPFSRRQGMEREDELDVWLGFQSLCLTGAPGHTSKRALTDGTTLGYLAVPPLG